MTIHIELYEAPFGVLCSSTIRGASCRARMFARLSNCHTYGTCNTSSDRHPDHDRLTCEWDRFYPTTRPPAAAIDDK